MSPNGNRPGRGAAAVGKSSSANAAEPNRHPDPTQATARIDEIVIGKRHRREMGDLDALARNIRELGVLLHPVVVRPDGRLIAGERRLRAAKLAGWDTVPVTVVPIDDIARGEFAENMHRKTFLPSEIDAIRRTLESQEREAARQRMSDGAKGSETFATLPGKTSDKIGAFAGVSGRTVEKIAAVVEAAEADREKYGKLLDDMDRTGRVNGPYRRLKNTQQAELIRAEPPPLPGRGPYRVGVSIMHEDSILWFWTTNFHMRHAFKVLDAWGFHDTSTILTWAKERNSFRAHWLLGQTEHAIMAVRGNPVVTLNGQTTLLYAPVRKPLGTKPVGFYDLVERLCPAPRYADFFSRYRHNDKWDCHGDQAPPDAGEMRRVGGAVS